MHVNTSPASLKTQRKYCCKNLEWHVKLDKAEKKKERQDETYLNTDSGITERKGRKGFGIPVHDGGSSFYPIAFCPFCGASLPDEADKDDLGPEKISTQKKTKSKYCCNDLERQLKLDRAEKRKERQDETYLNTDSAISWCKNQNGFGIPVHDGGTSFYLIAFCPFCGASLLDESNKDHVGARMIPV